MVSKGAQNDIGILEVELKAFTDEMRANGFTVVDCFSRRQEKEHRAGSCSAQKQNQTRLLTPRQRVEQTMAWSDFGTMREDAMTTWPIMEFKSVGEIDQKTISNLTDQGFYITNTLLAEVERLVTHGFTLTVNLLVAQINERMVIDAVIRASGSKKSFCIPSWG